MARRRQPWAMGGPHNHKPQATPMATLGHRRARRKGRQGLRLLRRALTADNWRWWQSGGARAR